MLATSSMPSLESCTPDQLTKYLLEHRFKGDGTELATFLLQAMENIPNIEEINEQLAIANNDDDDDDDDSDDNDETESVTCLLGSPIDSARFRDNRMLSTGNPNYPILSVSAVTPRSKFDLQLYEKGCIFTNSKNEQIVVSANHIKNVVMFPKREDCLKEPKPWKDDSGCLDLPGSLVLLSLEGDEVKFRGKPLTQICFQLPQHNSDNIMYHDDEEETVEDSYEDCLSDLFQSSFQVKHVARVYNPKINCKAKDKCFHFKSDQGDNNTSLMQGGMPFVKCYSGVNDGVLYPLEEGLLFFKPPQFIHRSELHSISCGRGSGGSSRFVDLVVTLDAEEEQEKELLEFTNIDREELQCLNNYIHNVLIKAMTNDIDMDNDVDSLANDDDDDEVDGSDDDNGTAIKSRKRKSQRNASLHARKATKVQLDTTPGSDESDEEDDDDFEKDESDDDDDDEGEEDDESIDGSDEGANEDESSDDEEDHHEFVKNSNSPKKRRNASIQARKATQVDLQGSVDGDGNDESDDDFVRKTGDEALDEESDEFFEDEVDLDEESDTESEGEA